MVKFANKIVGMVLIALFMFPAAADETAGLHDKLSQVLKAHVKDGVVDYDGIEDDQRFFQYLDELALTNPDEFATDQEKLAYWINAYNALAIKGIIDDLSPSSFFGRISYFKTTDYQAGGRVIDLYDLERDVIIPFDEPRIHFAIVCASMSCPKLISEAYVASRLDEQLQNSAVDFINDPAKNQFDTDRKVAKLSKIFDWFEGDFKKHSGSVQKYVSQYLKDANLAGELDSYPVKHLKYDWNLNGTYTGSQ